MSIKRILTLPGQGQTLPQTYLSQLQKTKSSSDLNIPLLKEQFTSQLGRSFTNKLLQPDPYYSSGDFLDRTSILQPAVVGLTCQIVEQIRRRDEVSLINPDLIMGHSLGELSALHYNELLDLEMALYLARKRGKFMEECVNIWGSEYKLKRNRAKFIINCGLMALIIPRTIANPIELIQTELDKSTEFQKAVFIANHNSPSQLVLSGKVEELQKFTKSLQQEYKIKSIPLKSQIPFHSPMLEEAEERFLKVLESQGLFGSNVANQKLKYPIISNLTGKIATTSNEALSNFVQSFSRPVLFMESLQGLKTDFPEDKFEFWSLGPNANVNQGLIKANFAGADRDMLSANEVFSGVEEFEELFKR
ncbi:hypothetical protein WICPIJ_006052 [Wickerhamomyces pijperi]|uniref:[acyl-carrier-protein] S-malonyltransferase n=1 Tax=Wickerhamomyces pijperi TaxID=599730 RepID=A0A9P8Q4F6_WICPI|nr:hypothetical protein WICPIJ_006052 [Wickerhamomyces pijperi]